MTDKSRDAKVEEIEYRMRDGKEYIVINQSSWYPTDSYTQETATEDYIFTHSNNGFNFVRRFVSYPKTILLQKNCLISRIRVTILLD